MRNIKLVLEDSVFGEFEKAKEKYEKKRGDKVSWERFIIDGVLRNDNS